jgi:hypothetical protein
VILQIKKELGRPLKKGWVKRYCDQGLMTGKQAQNNTKARDRNVKYL